MTTRDGGATLAGAIALFNGRQYLAAHELFEELWEAGEGSDADFYKGLIQASICLHLLQEGNTEGATKLYGGHRRYLGKYVPAHAGLDVAGLLAGMQSHLRPVLRGEGAGADPAPRIEVLADGA